MNQNVYEELKREIPPLEFLISLIERADELPPCELTKLVKLHASAGAKIVRKDLRFVVEGQSSGAAIVVTDVKALRTKASYDVQTLARELNGTESAKAVGELRKKKLPTLEFGQELVALAGKSKDEVAKAMAKNLQVALEQLAEVEERVAKGGHPALELKISRLAQQAWMHTDIATNCIVAALLKNSILRDPIIDAISHARSPMRLRVVGTQAAAASHPQKSSKGGKKGSKKGDKGGSGTPPSGSNGAPPTSGT